MSDGQSNASGGENELTQEDVWSEAVEEINMINPATLNWKAQPLPLARIKKIMKSEEFILHELEKEHQQQQDPDQEVEIDKQKIKFMISQEAPVLVTKACELLVKELTIRAWQHTERNRRRTLQRSDLHAAVGESEIFDFLIDIVPRVNAAPVNRVPPPAMGVPQMVGMPQMPADPSVMNMPAPDMTAMHPGMFFAQMQAEGADQQQQFQQERVQQQQGEEEEEEEDQQWTD